MKSFPTLERPSRRASPLRYPRTERTLLQSPRVTPRFPQPMRAPGDKRDAEQHEAGDGSRDRGEQHGADAERNRCEPAADGHGCERTARDRLQRFQRR